MRVAQNQRLATTQMVPGLKPFGPYANIPNCSPLNTKDQWAGEMAQRLRMLIALAEDPVSVPSTHMVAHNYLLAQVEGESTLSSDLCVYQPGM